MLLSIHSGRLYTLPESNIIPQRTEIKTKNDQGPVQIKLNPDMDNSPFPIDFESFSLCHLLASQ